MELSPQAPAIAHFAADAALFLHVGGGALALGAGAVAYAAGKGSRLHRGAGNVFFASMLTMASTASVVALIVGQELIALVALFTLYLVATGWRAAKATPGTVSRFDVGACAAAFVFTAGLATLALAGIVSSQGRLDGFPWAMALMFGTVMGVGAATDLTVIRRGGIAGPPRLARHIWRISAAAFMASGSFFLGQQKVMPEEIQGSPVLFVLGLAPLGLMIFWMLRMRRRRTRRAAVA